MTLKSMIRMTVALTAAVFPWTASAETSGEAAAAAVKQKIDAIFPLKGNLATLFTAEPSGNGVDLVFDAPLLLEVFKGFGVTAEGATPFKAHLMPQPDGTYTFDQQEKIAIKGSFPLADKKATFDLRAASVKGTGIADPELRYFKSMDTEITNFWIDYRTPDVSSLRTIDRMTVSQQTSNVANGRMDLVSKTVELGRRDLGTADGMSVERTETTTRIRSMPYRAVQDLLSDWLVQAQQGKAPAAIATSLREDIRLLMPIGTEVAMQGRMEKAQFRQNTANFGLNNVDYDVVWKDLTGPSSIDLQLNLNGIDTAGQLPPSYEQLVPDTITLDATIGTFDVQNAWRYYFSTVDFSEMSRLNTYQQDLVTGYLLPEDKIATKIEGLTVESPLYSARLFGSMSYDMRKAQPLIELRVITPSLDPLIAHFQDRAKVDPQMGQAAFFALMAKGFAGKAGNGSLYWDLAMKEDGRFTINGRDFTPPRATP
ncbi:hypothetical protein [Rhizobium glycinendophyticum]|uniref:DUF2125 domain-containing protein n=1 Tax=Rhizobium glycinendophyticum TaxID=2589807 RepID=A0A504V2E0_9HYPH|nr:hypothetical protein [Rhizobium glycinendophyticum]TPP11612.1 hypothetical protein FJQ55_12665 [Rhizobium glycinendophyticum]